MKLTMLKYLATVKISAKEKVSGGILYLYSNYLMRALCLIPLIMLWRSLFAHGSDMGMSMAQMLTYTYLNHLLEEVLNVRTPASSWLSGDFFIGACKRPTHILGDFAAQTVGGWVQMLGLYSLPMALLAPLLGVSLIPKSLWFLPSLALTVSLGFAIDFLFACFILRLKNAVWLAHSIRMAVTYMFSGSFIPFALLPWRLGDLFKYLPFGSLAGAPLSIFTGVGSPGEIVPVQAIWNLILWPVAIFCFYKSRERMVSYGG